MPVLTVNLYGEETEIPIPVECSVTIVKGSFSHHADSDLDYEGYEEGEVLSCPVALTGEQEEEALEMAIEQAKEG